MIIGGHVSIAGGISNAVPRAAEQGFNAIQIFASPPQSYSKPAAPQEEIDKFNKLYKEAGMQFLVFHAIYLLNLASEKPSLVHMSVESLTGYMEFGEKIGSVGTIFHIGSYKDRGFDTVKEQLVTSMKKILDKTPLSQYLIIENAAGGGGRVGSTLDELVYLYKELRARSEELGKRVKFCLDTQHLFATGIDTSDTKIFGDWLSEFDKQIGIENLVCIHANDSKTELSSKHDRHENIGEGRIGIKGFKNIMNQPLLKNKPFILEVPGFEGKGPDRRNGEILRSLK